MCACKIFANSYVPKYVPKDLLWYECDWLITYIDQRRYKEFISDPDAAIKNIKIINFNMILAQCRGMFRTHSNEFCQTIREKKVDKMPQKDRKKLSRPVWGLKERTFLLKEKKAFSHFLGEQKWRHIKFLIFFAEMWPKNLGLTVIFLYTSM